MLTYQDLLEAGSDAASRISFAQKAINWHCSTDMYKTAVIADEYYRGRNTTILQYEKTLVNGLGQIVPDRWSPNHKSTSNFFNIFVTQFSQFLLANGPHWSNPTRIVEQGTPGAVKVSEWDEATGTFMDVWKLPGTDWRLGDDFDKKLAEAGLLALLGGVSFGFFDNGNLRVFPVTEFAPLYDEENGALTAGVRFWRLDSSKPLRATLYELDGYTDFIWRTRKKDNGAKEEIGEVLHEKRPYIIRKTGDRKDEIDGTEIYDGLNYPSFPVVPLWGNPQHQSELVALREKIDAYDMILNGYENDLDNAQLYWIIKGADGMDQENLRRFIQQLHTLQVANPGTDQEVQAVTVNIPYQARQDLLAQLENRLYKDAQALDPRTISSGAATATQIRAAYEPLNTKTDQFEYCVLDFLDGILHVAGLKDKASFVRSMVMNVQEEIQSLVMAGEYLPPAYITRRILTVLGDGDQADAVLALMEQRGTEDSSDMPADASEIDGEDGSDDPYSEVIAALESLVGGNTNG